MKEVARSHHERYDGMGYPDGLKGEEIPLYARVIAIADCYDAMSQGGFTEIRLEMKLYIMKYPETVDHSLTPRSQESF